ncbi:MAG: FG-GAP repeat domain-containing protein [bacterium]
MQNTILQFKHIIVDSNNPADPHCKAVADIDNDGYGELLVASSRGEGLFWYHYPSWSKHKIADGSFTTDMATGDIDGDGYIDVVIPSNEGLMWYRNPMGWEGNPKDSWKATNISSKGANMHDIEVIDLDNDGKLDIVTRHQSSFGKKMGNQIHIWKQISPEDWIHHTFKCPHGEGLKVGDIDGDNLPDIIIGGRWYENPGDIINGKWIEHLFMSSEYFDKNWTNGDVAIDVGDINNDGRLEIALSPAEGSGHLSWFEFASDPEEQNWIEHILESKYDHAHAIGIADMNNDGYPDIVVAKMHQASAPQEVSVYVNPGSKGFWQKHIVAVTGSHNIILFDVDNDGLVDIFGANWNNRSLTGGRIELWLNRSFNE